MAAWLVAVLAADQHGLAAQDRLAEDLQALVAQRGAGLDHVGDDVGDTQGDRGLDGAVEADHVAGDALFGQVRRDQSGVAGGDPQAVDVLDRVGDARPGGEAEGRAGEAELHDLVGAGCPSRAAGPGR